MQGEAGIPARVSGSLKATHSQCNRGRVASRGGAEDEPAGRPGAIYQRSKSPTDYAQCLTQRWLATKVIGGSATVDSGPGAGGSNRLTLVISGTPGRVVEIAAQGSGSSIRYWNRSRDFGTGKPASVQAIEGCR